MVASTDNPPSSYGDFDEPDRHIGPFESIWSYSWYAYYNLIGTDGSDDDPMDGIQGGASDFWVGT